MDPGDMYRDDRKPEVVRALAHLATAIIGVGNMGGGMALNLLRRGARVVVHDIDAAKVDALVARGAERFDANAPLPPATIIAVVDADQTRDVLFGTAGGAASMLRGHTVVLCPTIAPADTADIASRLAERGIDCIDAPMSGGPARSADGTMSLMVACADTVFAAHEPLLRALSSKLFRVGTRAGDGARTKLVNNLLAAINLAGAAEALALAERLGLDAAQTLDVIEQSSGQSWIGSDRMRRALKHDTTPNAHMTLLAKDSRLALDMARGVDAATHLGTPAAELFARAIAAGLAKADDGALLDVLRNSKG